MRLHLIRLEESNTETLGILMVDDKCFCVTLEAKPIPVGVYMCMRYSSDRFIDTFEIRDVKNRSNILFHKGNTHKDTTGCVLLGEKFGYLKGERAILSSKIAFDRLMKRLKDKEIFTIEIKYG